jgi:hypothetical protein
MRECVKRQQQTETYEQGAKRKKTDRDCVTIKDQAMLGIV